jgi:nicotinate phosphoribosyltransferase
MAFGDEERSFRALQKLLGESTVFLIDTYDTIAGAHLAAQLGQPIWGVRLDSGNLGELAKQVRKILDDAGLQHAKIFATNDLDEYRIAEFVKAGVPLDAYGVGTQLATSADAPALSAVYKMVELKRGDEVFYTAKFSADKSTLPGAKQIYRYPDRDVVAHYGECSDKFNGEPLLRPILASGELVEAMPALPAIQQRSQAMIAKLPERIRQLGKVDPYIVEISPNLLTMAQSLRDEMQPAARP